MALELEKIEGIVKGKSLVTFTTFGIGGDADFYFELKDVQMIPLLLEACKRDGLPFVILGWGSNIIFSEKGFCGLVIHNLARKVALDNDLVVADSGTLLSQIIQFALKNSLTGMEKMMGLPGSIGGAVRGNAGAFGLEMKDLVAKAEIYREGEGVLEVGAEYFEFGYRHSTLKKTREILMRVWLHLRPGDSTKGREEVRQIIISRAGKHPSGKSSGSFFKNPSNNSAGIGHSAGYYIDQAGCKGLKIGGAFISDKHANFLMNDGTATLENVLELCSTVQDRVKDQFGLQLEREVQLVSEQGLL